MLSLVLALWVLQEIPTVQVQMTRPETYFEGRLLPLQNCADGRSDIAHFVIGEQKIQVFKASVEGFLPRSLKMAGEGPHDFATAEFLLPANLGCAEASTALATLSVDEQTPALPDGIFFRAGTFVPDEEVLRWRDSGRCHTEANHVLCAMALREGELFPTTLLISRHELSRHGGPLFAVCELKEGVVPEPGSSYVPHEGLSCYVTGTRRGMIYEANLKTHPMVEDIRAADGAITEILDRVY
jgi:hypothetical protein